MIIHQPELVHQDNIIHYSAKIETITKLIGIPDRLWFQLPYEYHNYISERSDGYLTSLLMLAMYLSEPVEVRGIISSRLAYGLQEWQQIFHAWLPDELHRVDIHFDKIDHTELNDFNSAVCTAFSGGVDSLHTVWCHLPQNQSIPSARLSHALYIHGFDIRLHQTEIYQTLFQNFARELSDLGVTLLSMQTNVYQFTQFRLKWEIAHGGPLIGAAHILGKLIRRFYIPSSTPYSSLAGAIDGTSPLTDHWLSTDTTEIVHFGCAYPRVEKIRTLASWPVAQRILHVCTNSQVNFGINNCNQCYKCIINRVRFETIGLLSKFTTFTQPFNHLDVLHLAWVDDTIPSLDYEIFKSSLAMSRWDIAIPMFFVMIWNKLRKLVITSLFNRLPRERRYQIKKRIFGYQEEKFGSIIPGEEHPVTKEKR